VKKTGFMKWVDDELEADPRLTEREKRRYRRQRR
jgi:hypothetical protein